MVADGTRLDAIAVAAVWDRAMECVREALIEGRPVVLMNIGTIEPITRRARRGYDPTTQSYVKRPRRRSVRFTPSRNLRDDL